MKEQDLDAVLRDLAGHAAAGHRARRQEGAGVPVADVARRVRRHRRVRTGLSTGAALVVVSGLVLGGAALADRPDPQPAGTPTPTAPTPTPSASSEPSPVLPTGDASLPYGACGSLTDAPLPGPVDDRVALSLTAGSPSLPAGAPLVVEAHRSREDTAAVLVLEQAVGHVVVTRDGVVVGTAVIGSTDRYLDDIVEGAASVTDALDRVALVTCAVEGDPAVVAGLPLPAGDYQVQLWSPVLDLGDDWSAARTADGDPVPVDDLPLATATTRTAVSAPVTVSVTGTADVAQADPGAGAALVEPTANAWPVCGAPEPVVDTAGSFRLETDASGTITREDQGSITAALTYTGPGRAELTFRGVFTVLVRDRVVVASNFVPVESMQRLFLGHGLPLEQGLASDVPLCGDDGTALWDTPLETGQYELYAAAFLTPRDYQVSPGERVAATGDAVMVYAGPVTLVAP